MTINSSRIAKGPSERANHRLLAISGAVGGIVGLSTALIMLQQPERTDPWSSPLPLWFAVLMALIWGVVIPITSWRWHRVVDEHERQAYRDGAVASFYTVGLGVPVWWFLWRGGALPPVQVEWVYGAMLAVGGLVWLWRKYR
jgi:membrane associated rhomboid family serine protease